MGGRKDNRPAERPFRRSCWMCQETVQLDTVGEHEHAFGEQVLRKRGWRYFLEWRGRMICPVCALRRARHNADISEEQFLESLEDLPF